MAFTFRPATRENVGLLIGLSGPSGSGKTFSGFRLAKGIAGDRAFAVIDTEAGRAKHYADQFAFDHGDLKPPFRPEAYADAIAAADAAHYPVIIVDSMSHEWAGEGGILDWQEDELDRMAGTDWKKREAVKMAAWIKPKMAHKQMVQRLLQVRAHLILCFRAEPKIEMVRNADGKMEIVEKKSLTGLHGWIPIAEKNLPYELTASFLLMADKPGVPLPIKLQEQHRALFPLDEAITEESGARLAAWAKGGAAPAIDWAARIREAETKSALIAIGKQLKAAGSSLPAATVEALRAAYDARLQTFKTPSRPTATSDPLAAGDISWGKP
jgi:AAA domain-containing protein